MRAPRLAIVALLGSLLAGCGIGLSVGIGSDGEDPYVELTTDATSVLAGGTVRVRAFADDPDGIDQVWFYRLDGERWTELADCHDDTRPYECDVPVPDDGRVEVQIRARAFDGWDDESDSNVVSVAVVR
jgi:hypothetical protein